MGQQPPPWPQWPVGLSSRIRALHLMLMLLLGVFTTPTHKTVISPNT